MTYKYLSSNKVIDTRWLTVSQQEIQLPGGQVVNDYYVGKKSDFAMVLPILDNNKIILLKEYRHGPRQYVWNLPVGGISQNETARAAAERELLEETGYFAKNIQLFGTFFVSSSWLIDKAFLFIARDLIKIKEVNHELTEDITIELFDYNIAREMVMNNQIQDPYSSLLLLAAK